MTSAPRPPPLREVLGLREGKDLAELAREAVPQPEVRSLFASFLADE
ncbi:MAG: hypothetical protein IPL61_28190 [Myxococcales bacterium]|nr:hypothetical protein [Myxococcales bacterium]